jgi:signal transduction histidine kinase
VSIDLAIGNLIDDALEHGGGQPITITARRSDDQQ